MFLNPATMPMVATLPTLPAPYIVISALPTLPTLPAALPTLPGETFSEKTYISDISKWSGYYISIHAECFL